MHELVKVNIPILGDGKRERQQVGERERLRRGSGRAVPVTFVLCRDFTSFLMSEGVMTLSQMK